MWIAENRLIIMFISSFSRFKITSPYLAISSAPIIKWNASSVTNSGVRKVCESNITAADRNGLRRLVDAVELRLVPSETNALKVKTVVPAFPDHPAPKALIRREQEEGGFVSVRQTPATISPVRPSSPVGIGQEKSSFSFSELLMHPFLELRFNRECKAVPHELIQFQYACFDPFLKAGAFAQAARRLADIVLAVFARHIFGRIMKRAAVYPTAPRFLAGLRHHQLFHCLQRRIAHEIAWHK
jgi:hypothetical protein